MMNINEIIQRRRAVYPNQYESAEIEDSFIKLLLKNANTAPSHKLTQPGFFKVYKANSKDRLGIEMANCYEQFSNGSNLVEIKKKKIIEKCKLSNCIIAIFMKKDSLKRVPEWEEIAATAMAVQIMWLTCTANNIGCYWSTPKYTFLISSLWFVAEYFSKILNNLSLMVSVVYRNLLH